MNHLSKEHIIKLQIEHTFYDKTRKFIWVISILFILGGTLQFGGGLYASYMNAPIRTAVNYGYAMSGDPYLKEESEKSDPYSQSIGDGFGTLSLGLTIFTAAAYLRRKSRQYMKLPDDLKNAYAPPSDRPWEQVLSGMNRNNANNRADELKKLHQLLQSGALTEPGYATAKANILSKAG